MDLTRANTIGTQTATCSISLRKSGWGLDANYGNKSIGSASVSNGYYQGPSESFDISWTAGDASSKYYLATVCTSSSGNTYKEGSAKTFLVTIGLLIIKKDVITPMALS